MGIFSVDTPVHTPNSPTDSPGYAMALNPWVFLWPEALLLFGKTLTLTVSISDVYMFLHGLLFALSFIFLKYCV